jgi:dihydroorotate dehydrogenase/NAD-dependent dihydropyrimidine dehydrogenase PreA subunit
MLDKIEKESVPLETQLAGLRLANPLFLTCFPQSEGGRTLKALALEGKPGAVVTETISQDVPVYENNGSNRVETAKTLSAKEWISSEIPVAQEGDVPVIVNLNLGVVSDDVWVDVAKTAKDSGAAAIELGWGGQAFGVPLLIHPERPGCRIVERIKKSVSIPLFVEIPYLYPLALKDVVANLVDSGTDGIITSGKIAGTKVDIESIMKSKGGPTHVGYIGGQIVKPVSLAMTQLVAANFPIPVIGSGGIRFGEDAIEYIMAGASAVQVTADPEIKNLRLFQNPAKQVLAWMENHDIENLKVIRGRALKMIGQENAEPYRAQVDTERCSACGDCETICASVTYKSPDWPTSAIALPKEGGTAVVIEDRCVGCGWCKVVCHRDAISLDGYSAGL